MDGLATREAKDLTAQLVEQYTGYSNAKNTLTQSKHENRWELKTLKNLMECANRKKKSNRRKLDMGLDVVLRNMEQETNCGVGGK